MVNTEFIIIYFKKKQQRFVALPLMKHFINVRFIKSILIDSFFALLSRAFFKLHLCVLEFVWIKKRKNARIFKVWVYFKTEFIW